LKETETGKQLWRTIDATRERQQKLGVPLSYKDYEDLKEAYKPGFREYKNKMIVVEHSLRHCAATWPTDYNMQMSCIMDGATKVFAPELATEK
jgi:hypothetical protein